MCLLLLLSLPYFQCTFTCMFIYHSLVPLLISIFIYWKSWTSDLLVLMLCVLLFYNKPTMEKNYLILTLTLSTKLYVKHILWSTSDVSEAIWIIGQFVCRSAVIEGIPLLNGQPLGSLGGSLLLTINFWTKGRVAVIWAFFQQLHPRDTHKIKAPWYWPFMQWTQRCTDSQTEAMTRKLFLHVDVTIRLGYTVHRVRCFLFRIKKVDHRRSERVYFHAIGLAGVDDMKSPRWRMLSLEGIMKLLGHKNVSIAIGMQPRFLNHCLTHWGRQKNGRHFQTTFSKAFSWMKMY